MIERPRRPPPGAPPARMAAALQHLQVVEALGAGATQRLARAVEQFRRDGRPARCVAERLAGQEVAVVAARGLGAGRLAIGRGVDLLGGVVVGRALAPADAQERRHEPWDDPRAQEWRRDRRLVERPGGGAQQRAQVLPRVRRAGRDVARPALGRGGDGDEPRPAAPVVAEQDRALDPEGVEQRDGVLGDPRLAIVAVRRWARPAEPTGVHREEAELGQLVDHPPPLVPMLREAVQREHRRRAVRSRVRDVRADAGRQVVVTVLDAGPIHARDHTAAAASIALSFLADLAPVRGFPLTGALTNPRLSEHAFHGPRRRPDRCDPRV